MSGRGYPTAADVIHVGGDAKEPQYAVINAAANDDNEIVAAVSGKKIRVLTYTFQAANPVNATWKSGSSTNLSGALPQTANTGISTTFCPIGHFETASGQALNLYLSAAVQVSGHITYVEV